MLQPRIAIVAAVEREVAPLIRNWKTRERDFQGRAFRFFETEEAVLVCGGIGSEAARRATEAVISLYQPHSVQSVGFAGALDPELKVGTIFLPKYVIDARDGSRTETSASDGDLLSFAVVAEAGQKQRLANAYGARAVDMEAAAVARAAQAHHLPFAAVKVISDEVDAALPPLQRFVRHDGSFQTGRMLWFAAWRPWLWPRVIRLGRNSARGSRALSRWLQQSLSAGTGNGAPEAVAVGGRRS
jgi:adenosylhomocysteine nucleosidase